MSIYHTTIAGLDVHRWKELLDVPRYDRLLVESGAINVSSSLVQITGNWASENVVDCVVKFDSRYWTGR